MCINNHNIKAFADEERETDRQRQTDRQTETDR